MGDSTGRPALREGRTSHVRLRARYLLILAELAIFSWTDAWIFSVPIAVHAYFAAGILGTRTTSQDSPALSPRLSDDVRIEQRGFRLCQTRLVGTVLGWLEQRERREARARAATAEPSGGRRQAEEAGPAAIGAARDGRSSRRGSTILPPGCVGDDGP